MDTIINLILAAIIIFICITVPVFIIILRAVKKANPDKNSDMKKQSWNDVHKSIEKQSLNNNLKRTTNCRDCDGLVSKSAKKCPHCGADNPHLDKAGFGFLTFIRVIILLGVLFVSILLFLFALDLMELSNRLKY